MQNLCLSKPVPLFFPKGKGCGEPKKPDPWSVEGVLLRAVSLTLAVILVAEIIVYVELIMLSCLRAPRVKQGSLSAPSGWEVGACRSR